jgi:uroporphyrinogen decarboxylase
MNLWAASDVDAVHFRDDWGAAQGLLLAPEMWRELFKPLYRDYCDIIHGADKFAFYSSDGDISAIFDDLVEIGVDAIHCQLFAMDMEAMSGGFRNRITFWGDIDRREVLTRGTRQEVAAAVRRLRGALDFGRGGLIAQCQWDPEVPFHNIAAVFESWLTPLPMNV